MSPSSVDDLARSDSWMTHLWPRKGAEAGGHPSGSHGGGGGGGIAVPHSVSDPVGVSLPHSSGAKSTISTTSKGGGKPFSLPKTSPFAGRRAGGGTRGEVYGTSQYGSGYPYGGAGSYVNGRPFPYVFWPVPIGLGYYGADEYGRNQTERPGGNTTVAIINSLSNITDTYRIVGDSTSVNAVYDALGACNITNGAKYITDFTGFADASFNATNNGSLPKPEQVVQWYRASSFALALDGYNNTAALPSNMPASNSTPFSSIPNTPLPSTLNTQFFDCINSTIGSSLPLVVPHRHHISFGAIAAIGICSGFVGFALFIWCCCCGCRGPWSKKRGYGYAGGY